MNRFKILITFVIGCLLAYSTNVLAMEINIENGKALPYEDGNVDNSFFIEKDDNYIIANKNSLNGNNLSIKKIDKDGNVLKRIDLPANNSINVTGLKETKDGFVVAAYTRATSLGNDTIKNNGSYDWLILKFNNNLEKVWSTSFGFSGNDNLMSITALSDGSVVAAGYSKSAVTDLIDLSGIYNAVILKLDKDGNYVNASSSSINDSERYYYVDSDNNDDVIVYGYSELSLNTRTLYINKFNSNLDLIGNHEVGNVSTNSTITSGAIDKDGSYLMTHSNINGSQVFSKYDSKTYEKIFETEENDDSIFGSSYWTYGSINIVDDYYYLLSDSVVTVVDRNGNIIYTKALAGFLNKIFKTSDGKYQVYGFINNAAGVVTNGKDHVKFDLNITYDITNNNNKITLPTNAKVGEEIDIVVDVDPEHVVDKYIVNGKEQDSSKFIVTGNMIIDVKMKEKYTYTILSQSSMKFNDNDISIRIDGYYDKFDKLFINNVEVQKDNYTVKEGSTIITLSKEYLSTLSSGVNEVKVTYTNGKEATTTIEVLEKATSDVNTSKDTDVANSSKEEIIENPQTLDKGILSAIVLSIASFGIMVKCSKRFKLKKITR